jgi:hypothetical protein
VVVKVKHESLKACDLVGYDNVPIDYVEPVVCLLRRWVFYKNTCSGAKNKFI